MKDIGRNLRQRFQNKAPRVHGGMRNGQTGLVYNQISEEHDININGSWAFYLGALTSHRSFQSEHARKKLLRRKLGFHGHSTIQKKRLLLYFHRLGFIM